MSYVKDEYIGPVHEDGSIPSEYWDDPNYWTVVEVEEETPPTE